LMVGTVQEYGHPSGREIAVEIGRDMLVYKRRP